MALGCPLPNSAIIVREEEKGEKIFHNRFGFCKIHLADTPVLLNMVVVAGFGDELMMLLNSLHLKKEREILLKTIK